MLKKRKEPIFNLDAEEQALSDSVDRGEWVSVKDLEEEKVYKPARNYLSKTAEMVNIPLLSNDLKRLKKMAAQEGLPYENFIASILHKYSSGLLNEHEK